MNAIPKPVVLLSGPEDDCPTEPQMRFRLTYEGLLRSVNRDPLDHKPDLLALHKHVIRSSFHGQLKQLWETDEFLKQAKVDRHSFPPAQPTDLRPKWATSDEQRIPLKDALAGQYVSQNGFNFVPLVTERFNLLCSLSILFLRRDIPGSLISAGDIDNRVKTIIDALRPPQKPNEFIGKDMQPIVPEPDQTPFYCLMEDDKQVSHLSVETDTLLDPINNEMDLAKVRLIITVELRPYYITMQNLNFV
tara:strand:- start:1216 stop:1956 length:741 start_codon:yes stop_codon:yes gene_type:complete